MISTSIFEKEFPYGVLDNYLSKLNKTLYPD